MDEVEEGRRDQVVEIGGLRRGAEASAGGDRVEGAVRALFAQVEDVVGEVGAEEAVAEEARGRPRQADPGVAGCRAPSDRRSRGSCRGCALRSGLALAKRSLR